MTNSCMSWVNSPNADEPTWEVYLCWAKKNEVCVPQGHSGVRFSKTHSGFLWVSCVVVQSQMS